MKEKEHDIRFKNQKVQYLEEDINFGISETAKPVKLSRCKL